MSVEKTKFGFIGISGRGRSILRDLLAIDSVEVAAVCDKYDDRAQHGFDIVKEETGNEPDIYLDYKELLKRDDIKAVVICTTWITHSRIAIDAMRAGKHAAIEVGGAASKNAGRWSEQARKLAKYVCCLKTAVMTGTKWQFIIWLKKVF